MSDEQPTSWRERFFGSGPGPDRTPAQGDAAPDDTALHDTALHDAALDDTVPADDAGLVPNPASDEATRGDGHSAELAPDAAEVASTSVDEHDAHQPLVEHETDARSADSPIEPTVIAPSALRGPSHSAAHPDDTVRSTPTPDRQADAATSSLERPEIAPADHASPDAPTEAIATEPPPLVEPRRPSFGLRRQADADASGDGGGSSGIALSGLAAAAAASGASRDDASDAPTVASPRREAREEREFVEPEPTQAIDQQRPDDRTRAIDTRGADDLDAAGDASTTGDTRVLDTQEPATETRPQRFGIVRDDTQAPAAVDGATAAGTPVVLVEEPVPPRRKGARGVGFAVALLATLIFAILFAAAFFAVGYLFDRQFDAAETLQSVWLRPSYLLPVVAFFLAYWIVTLIVNRAGWWAHVLGAFIVALIVYGAHIGGAYMEAQGGWAGYTALPGIDAQALSQLLLAPLSVLAFVIAREVPVWVGGIVARRGRRAREHNRQAMDDFNAQQAGHLSD